MCSGSDVMKVVGIAAAVYTGGASLGMWGGAAEGAGALAAGEISGEIAGAGAGAGMSVVDAATGAVMSSTPAVLAGGSPEYLSALGSVASGVSAATSGGTGAAAPAASGAGGLTGAKALSALSTAAKFAPLAQLAMSTMAPSMPDVKIPSPVAPPPGQASQTPEQSIFKKALRGMGDPTALTGPGGVSNTSLTLGKATVLGS